MLDDLFPDMLPTVLRLAVAYFCALLVGLERGKAARTAGFRTFPLVSLGACAYFVLGKAAFDGNADAEARLIQGLMTGIGFVGGGAILKEHGTVRGLATAASLWNTGAIGLAAAYGQYGMSLFLALANLATLHLFTPSRDHEPPQRD